MIDHSTGQQVFTGVWLTIDRGHEDPRKSMAVGGHADKDANRAKLAETSWPWQVRNLLRCSRCYVRDCAVPLEAQSSFSS